MWDTLTRTDLKQAKNQLDLERAALLTRHAEELKVLDGKQGEVETLERLIAGFMQTFKEKAAPASKDEGTAAADKPKDSAEAEALFPSPNFTGLVRRFAS